MRVRVLGPLAVEHDGREVHVAGSHRRRLLAFLALRGGRVASVDAIADALWGDDPPATFSKSIQNHVARLRASFAGLGHDLIETSAGGYRLVVGPDEVDAIEFERLGAEGRRLQAEGRPADAVAALTAALSLWRGEPYGEFSAAEFAVGESGRLSELRLAAQEDLAEARLGTGDVEIVIADLARLITQQPGRERAWGLLIRALYAAGRQRDALTTYQRARKALADGFGLEPGPELRDLERRVLEQDPALVVRRRPVMPLALRSDAAPFVDRERERAWLADVWRAARTGSGQVRLLLGVVDSGRTRLAAEVAALAANDGAQVVYARGGDAAAATAAMAQVPDLSRSGPVLAVLDDMEWAAEATVAAIAALASTADHWPVMVLLIADPAATGAALQALRRLDPEGARTLELAPMDDHALAEIVAADGVDPDACMAVVATARGLPGVARRAAASWAEREATDRLTTDASLSIGATVAAAQARASVFDDVLVLVGARARRDELTSSAWAGRQPYRSLAAYEAHDADLFVGRERLLAEAAARVLARRMVAVVGPSGSGKSSLVRAGLVPLVRSGRLPGSAGWQTSVIVPGSDPASELAVVDLDERGPQLLVVDQFEETFAAADGGEGFALQLAELCLDAALDVHVVIVLRDDQYAGLAAMRSLAEILDGAQVLVGPPTEDELRRIVEVPARRTGCAVEPALTSLVVDEVAGHDAALPLVSAALAEVWEHRDGDELTAERYLALGGLAAAVERMGTKAVAQVGEAAVRDAMLRLADVTEDGQWLRRRVPAADIPPDLQLAVDALVDARLVQRSEGHVDVVHEVAFSAWPLLVRWLEEVRADRLLERDVVSAARAWDAGDREDDYLYRGARLAAAAELVARRDDGDDLTTAFVAASSEAATRAADDRARQQSRVNRRLRGLLAGVGVLLVVALVAGALALRQAARADSSATRAEARLVGDRAVATAAVDRALLLAVEATRLDDAPETRADLLAVLSKHPGLLAPARRGGVHAVTSSLDGSRVVTYDDGRLAVVDGSSLRVLARSQAGVPPIAPWADVERSRDGARLAVAHHGGNLPPDGTRVFASRPVVLLDGESLDDLPTDRQLGGIPPMAAAQDLAFSDDGRLLAVSFALFDDAAEPEPSSSPVLLWDLLRPAQPIMRVEPGAAYNNILLSADGSRLFAAVWPPGGVRSYDVKTGALVAALDGVGGRLGVSADGTTLAVTGLNDGQVVLLGADTLTERMRLTGKSLTAFGPPVFSPDGSRLAAPDWESGVVYVWDVATGSIAEELVGHAAFVTGLWFGPTGATLSASSESGVVATWNLREGHRFVSRAEPPAGLARAEVARPIGRGRVAYVGGLIGSPAPGGTLQLRDLASGALAPLIELGHGGVGEVGWRADGLRVATGGSDGAIRVWDARSGGLLVERVVASGSIGGVSYTRDGRRLLVAEERGGVYAVDAETLASVGRRVDTARSLLWPVDTVDPDVALVVSNDTTGESVLFVDVEAGRVVRELAGGLGHTWVSASHRGERVAFSGAGGEVRLYDAAAGRWLSPPVVAHDGRVGRLSWSADDSVFVSSGVDGRVSLWDGETGALVGRLALAEPDGVLDAVFEGDTTTVLVAAADGSVYRWDADPSRWVAFACAVAGRNLTPDEWREAFGDRPYRRTCPLPETSLGFRR